MFSEKYPNLDWWVNNQGWIEIGTDDHSESWVRVVDEGGLCWEDEESSTLDEALKEAEIWLSDEIEDRFGEDPPKKY